MIPGEYFLKKDQIICNANRRTERIKVANNGDRPIQVGSHFHFFEANKALVFDRFLSFGMRLNIPSGTAVRFEPGEEKEVSLVHLGGTQVVHGLNGITAGSVRGDAAKKESIRRAVSAGFMEVEAE